MARAASKPVPQPSLSHSHTENNAACRLPFEDNDANRNPPMHRSHIAILPDTAFERPPESLGSSATTHHPPHVPGQDECCSDLAWPILYPSRCGAWLKPNICRASATTLLHKLLLGRLPCNGSLLPLPRNGPGAIWHLTMVPVPLVRHPLGSTSMDVFCGPEPA